MKKYCIKKFLKKNSSTILSIIGCAGVIATSIVTAKNTVKAVQIYDKMKMEEENNNEKYNKKDYIINILPTYYPTILVSSSTILFIVSSIIINKKDRASFTAAYGLVNAAYNKYKDDIKKYLGVDEYTALISNIAKDEANNSYLQKDKYDIAPEETLYYDFYSLQLFESTPYIIENAISELNNIFVMNGYVTLNMYYSLIGADLIPDGDFLGWTMEDMGYPDKYKLIKFDIQSAIMSPNDEECYIISMETEPSYLWL